MNPYETPASIEATARDTSRSTPAVQEFGKAIPWIWAILVCLVLAVLFIGPIVILAFFFGSIGTGLAATVSVGFVVWIVCELWNVRQGIKLLTITGEEPELLQLLRRCTRLFIAISCMAVACTAIEAIAFLS